MQNERDTALAALRSLVRFFLVYGLALAALLWLLPAVALYLQSVYDSLGTPARFALLSLPVAIAAVWQASQYRRRSSEPGSPGHETSEAGGASSF